MNELVKSFKYEPNEVRISLHNNEPYFCLKDVCDALGIKNSRDVLAKSLDEKGVEKIYTPTDGGEQEIVFINEPNLYRVIFRSNKKEAKKFQDWVFNDVLPSIRKNGIYVPTTETPELLQKVNELETKLNSFVTLDSHEQQTLQKAVARRVYEVIGEPEMRKLGFAELYREIKERFGVPSYRDVAKLDFHNAMNYVKGWIPKKVAA